MMQHWAAVVAAHGLAAGIILPNVILTVPGWLLTYGATTIGLGMMARIGGLDLAIRPTLKRAGKTEENT